MLSGRLSSKRDFSVQEPAINVTPLIDVVFVLLISFILIAPLLEMDSVALAPSDAVPSHQPISQDSSSPITIHVLADNRILVNGRPVSMADLSKTMAQLQQRYPQAKPRLIHDKRALFGTYQSIKNCLETLGFSEMEIILSPS